MTTPLFFLPEGTLVGAEPGRRVLLDGPEGRHAATVQRLQVGEQLLVADGTGAIAQAEVVGAATGELDLRLLHLRHEPSADPRFVLVQALAKGGRDEQAVEQAVELGVDEVVPWQAQRSIVVWRGERANRAHRKWESLVLAAAKQTRRARVPQVRGLADGRAVIQRVQGASLALVLHEDADTPLAATGLPETGEVLVLVGPEGGIATDELADLVAAGGRPVRLGRTVLRSSSAGPAALAVLNARARWR